MSRIDKLSISGVRSFSPSVREAIQFNTPLTLIVGYNGSGKTTIIECLKYATTGELPPNSKGGAFIHDPKLCGEKEVMAQVKLQFHSINHRQHVATRSLQLTVKKTTRSQKTLDCSLVVVNNGEKTTTSTRQAQLDEMIPERLGVSPAILDAVIFCHQDESLWPLSEPAALKKRFDEIFEALKYTKAIENLKVLRKKQIDQLAKLQAEEAHNKQNRDRGERAEKRMTNLQAEIEAAREKCDLLSAEMQETQEKIKEKHEQANSFLQIVQSLQNKRELLQYRQDAINELRQTFEEISSEDDDALEDSLSRYEQILDSNRQEAAQLESQHDDLQQDLATVRSQLSDKLSELGRYLSERDKHESQLESRSHLIADLARSLGFRDYERQLSEQDIVSFHEKTQTFLDEKKRELEQLQKTNQVELDKATAAITQLEGRKAASTQDRVSAKQRMTSIERRIGVLQNESSLISVDEGAKAVLDGQLQDVGDRLHQVRRDLEKSDWDQKLSEENDKLRQLESENEKLSFELVDGTRLASERAQLDLKKADLVDRKRKLQTLTATWKKRLDSIVGDDWNPTSLESSFHSILARQSQKLQEARRKSESAREKKQMVEYKLQSSRHTHEAKTREAAECMQTVLAALGKSSQGVTIEDYATEVSLLEEEVERLRNELSLFDELAKYYEKCQRVLESKKQCLLCERHFGDGQGASLARLSKKIAERLDPKGKLAVEKDVEESMAKLEALRGARASYDGYNRLSAELPALGEECKAVEGEYNLLQRQLEEVEFGVAEEEEKHRELEELSRTVSSIARAAKELEEAESEVNRIASQSSSMGTARGADEVQELQTEVTEKMRGLKNRISKLTNDRQRARDQANSLELEKSELKNKVSRASGQLEKKEGLQSQVQALKEDLAHQRDVIRKADDELEKLEPHIIEARAAREASLRRGRENEKTVAEEREGIASRVGAIAALEGEISAYVERGGASELASAQQAKAELEQKVRKTEMQMGELAKRRDQLKEEMDKSDGKKKNISDNLNYRKHVRALESVRREIAGLEERRADEDYDRLDSEARLLENQSSRLLAERGSVMGSMKTKDEELGRLLEEWEMDYKDSRQRFRESHIRVEATKAAIEDLAQCGGAVDKAVMQFHALKMAEVNQIAGELWQSTYQGTDIDTILIRSDTESGGGASGGAAGRRNYNYRLCMVKQGAEMDMRGRCSAGQKVLASIVVRLALAESFGLNCGLIALDEPTTNLDSDNIKSLAESLHAIIRARQAQPNFQLIVITHDEDFLRHMRCADFCDSFFRVKRDERQASVIVREGISKLF